MWRTRSNDGTEPRCVALPADNEQDTKTKQIV